MLNKYLVNNSGHEQPNLHKNKVSCRVKVGQICECKVVVKAVERCWHHVVSPDHPILSQITENWEEWISEIVKSQTNSVEGYTDFSLGPNNT
jgi:hypothetical protein